MIRCPPMVSRPIPAARCLPEVGQRLDQPGHDVAGAGRRDRHPGPSWRARDAQGEARAEHEARGRDDEEDRVRRVVGHDPAQDQPQRGPDAGADQDSRGADGGHHRVGDHVLLGVDGVRQRGRQRSEQEPVQAHREQHVAVEDHLDPRGPQPGGHQRGQRQREHRPAHVDDDQDLPPRPAVQHHADERPQHREGQQGDGQHGGDGDGVGLAFGGEEDVGRQPDLQHAIAGLGGHPDGEQAAEVLVPPELTQAADELHQPCGYFSR